MNIEFEKLTESLLHRYECVVLPDFGGFIVRDSPCNFNAAGNVIKPKSKHIFFNPHLKHNDGLLYNEIRLHFGLNYQDALNYYLNLISDYKKNLESFGSVKFGNLGTFYQGKEGNYWFAPGNINLSLETYGLGNVDVKTLAQEEQSVLVSEPVIVKETKVAELLPDNKALEEVEKPTRPGYKAWLVAATLALLVHFVYLNVENKGSNTQEAGLLPEISVLKPADTVSSLKQTVTDTLAQESGLNTEDTFKIAETPLENPSATVQQVNPDPAPAQAEVIDQAIQETPVTNVTPEAETPLIKQTRIAKYKLEENAISHSNDLKRKGQKCTVEHNGDWYEVFIEQ